MHFCTTGLSYCYLRISLLMYINISLRTDMQIRECPPITSSHNPANLLQLLLGFHLGADGAANRRHALVNDAVKDLNAIATPAQHTRLVEHIQVL